MKMAMNIVKNMSNFTKGTIPNKIKGAVASGIVFLKIVCYNNEKFTM